MAKPKKAQKKIKIDKQTSLSGSYTVPEGWIKELNFFDMTGSKAKTKGTSNKFYHIEIQVDKDNRCQLYTEYGPTGRVQTREYRFFDLDKEGAEKEFNRIIKSKVKKGYQEIDVAQRALGSSEAKKHTKAAGNKGDDSAKTKKKSPSSQLHPETSRIISSLMGATNNFVSQTLKCPLGQLTSAQIDTGRDYLNKALSIVNNSNKLSKKEHAELEEITNKFYTLIPHNLGAGSRGQMTHLLLDSKDKINKKEYDLDTLSDAKSIGDGLASNAVYDQYLSLDTDFKYIEPNQSLFNWLNNMVQETRANNHRFLGKITLLNAWDIQRKKERDVFLKRAKEIAPECGKQVIPAQITSLVKSREDIPAGDSSLFKKANVIPLFHGTRTENITGILKKGLLIRPSGAVICGAMYGVCLYLSPLFSKSANYSSVARSYWARGSSDKGYLLVIDCALGKSLIARGPGRYTLDNIKPHHSVWAKGGQSGVINDEIMLYRTDQHNIRYLLEFTCN